MERPDPAIWDVPEIHRALARRDVTTFYRLLRARGWPQRRISELTGQSQSEVSEIIKGRQVVAYRVLEKIAAGFGIPRGHMGLAYADANGNLEPYPGDQDDDLISQEVDDEMISRRFLGMASAALFGSAVIGDPTVLKLIGGSSTSLGSLVKRDAEWINTVADTLWSLDLAHGGASSYGASSGITDHVVGALRNSTPHRDLQLAASRLCRIAAWGAFDTGQRGQFWRYHATALDLAQQAKDTATVTTIISAAGRAELLSGRRQAAAKLFELTSARRKPTAVDWGLIGAAYAPNHPVSARRALDRLRDAAGADTLDAKAMTGHVNFDVGDYQEAIAAYSKVVPHRCGRLALQETVPLAIAYLRIDERSTGLRHAETVLNLAEDVGSSRGCGAELTRLSTALAAQNDSTARDLARAIRTYEPICAP